MTIRFAAARPSLTAFIGRTLWAVDLPHPVNDNAAAPPRSAPRSRQPDATGDDSDRVLRDALLHFAIHGLGAAAEARREAQRSFAAGRYAEYRHWLDLCRYFDRPMAAKLARKLEGQRHAKARQPRP